MDEALEPLVRVGAGPVPPPLHLLGLASEQRVLWCHATDDHDDDALFMLSARRRAV
jgi:hypothetical protein